MFSFRIAYRSLALVVVLVFDELLMDGSQSIKASPRLGLASPWC